MVQRISNEVLERVNKTRARNMFDNGYFVIITMNGKFIMSKNEGKLCKLIWAICGDKNFDYIVSDFYNTHKGELSSYNVEYYVTKIHNKMYVRNYNKEQQRKHKAKRNR